MDTEWNRRKTETAQMGLYEPLAGYTLQEQNKKQ
jgi:hypothetical protein